MAWYATDKNPSLCVCGPTQICKKAFSVSEKKREKVKKEKKEAWEKERKDKEKIGGRGLKKKISKT